MSVAPKKYPVDGREMTVREAATLLGVTTSVIYNRMARQGHDLQNIVSQYRVGLAGTMRSKGTRYYIDGEWLTVTQVAERLGIEANCLRNYLWRHRDADGKWPLISEVVDRYRRGAIRGGYPAKLHKVGKRSMTQAEWAAFYGVRLTTFRVCIWREGSVQAAVAFYEKRREKRAQDDILKILGMK